MDISCSSKGILWQSAICVAVLTMLYVVALSEEDVCIRSNSTCTCSSPLTSRPPRPSFAECYVGELPDHLTSLIDGTCETNAIVSCNTVCMFECDAGYTITHNESIICKLGMFTPVIPSCNETNECDSNPCQNNGTCYDLIDDYNCTCVPGYEGRNCENQTNECDSNPCQNNGTCYDLIDDYNCICVPGYEGKNCENLSVVITPSDTQTADTTLLTTYSTLTTHPEMTTGLEDNDTTTRSIKLGAGVGGSFLFIVIIVVFVKYKRRLKHGSSKRNTASEEPRESPGMRDNPTFESSDVRDLRLTDVAGCHSGNDPYMALTTPHDGPTLQVYEPLRDVISEGDGYEVPINGTNGKTGPEYCKTLHKLQVHPETDYEITHEYQDLKNSVVGRNNSLGNEIPGHGLQVKPETDYEAIHDYENPGIIG